MLVTFEIQIAEKKNGSNGETTLGGEIDARGQWKAMDFDRFFLLS